MNNSTNTDEKAVLQSEILARLDERTKSMQDNMKNLHDSISNFKVDMKIMNDSMSKRIQDTSDNINDKIEIIEKKFEAKIEAEIKKSDIKIESLTKDYVRNERFAPIEKVVYGIIGMILITFAMGLIYLVIPKPG
jgi:hypothetical protein